ncbi:activity-regulated cytoskeleton associated protein 1-like [Temnothorax americanus]|uniref:activity-regulated cytoskeleton associated protein 1-like n=1 Tax=Temnothorax americanus TaxID=1964332 RepID=UPI0040679682
MGLPELLRGDALLWCRNNRSNWQGWEDFCADFREYYLPRRYRATLVREIQTRLQKPDEPYRKFATEMLTMMRRATGFAEDDQVEALYNNMHPRYQMYIRRDTVTRTRDILRLAEEFEHIEEQTQARQVITPKPAVAAADYDRRECCWRCKQRGHTRFDCRRPPRRFCLQCGRDGVFTKDRHPPPGNAARAGEEAAVPRSSE